jgi:hypothetical protein
MNWQICSIQMEVWRIFLIFSKVTSQKVGQYDNYNETRKKLNRNKYWFPWTPLASVRNENQFGQNWNKYSVLGGTREMNRSHGTFCPKTFKVQLSRIFTTPTVLCWAMLVSQHRFNKVLWNISPCPTVNALDKTIT